MENNLEIWRCADLEMEKQFNHKINKIGRPERSFHFQISKLIYFQIDVLSSQKTINE